MISAIKPYEEGKVEHLPAIHLSKYTSARDDFKRLADTLNSLSNRVEAQIAALKHERNEKEAVLDSLIEGVIAVDDRGQVTFANHMAIKMLEIHEHQMVGAKLSDLQHEEFHDVLIACQHQQEVLTFTCQLNELQKVYLDVVAVPMGRDRGAILVLQDKSLHYKALEMRKDFIANASHELKTPITIIKGFAETLQDMPHLSPQMVQEITSKIVRNCTRMEKLVKNLLKLADIENLPRSRQQRCRMSEVAETCKQMVESVYPTAQINIRKPMEEPYVLGDAELLELAVMNLMDNAAKYSKPPAQIVIIIEPVSAQEQLKIIVADKGMGIPKEDLEYIFQRFYTVNKAHSRQLGGSGLGLSIVETIIEKHFGKISVTSTLGEGTTFTILLPMNHREPQEA
jgi:two-component system phosphate regulon sensor histidine kinase PhoR